MDPFTAPDTAAARAAFEVCAQYAPPWLRNHSLRSYSWARIHAAERAVEHDDELLYVAALLHDLTLVEPFDSHRTAFEEAGGHLAWVFAAGAGWTAARRDRLAEVIVVHMRADVPAEQDPEGHLLQIAVSADVSGGKLGLFRRDTAAALLETFPRHGFAPAFLAAFRDQADRKPHCAAADLIAGGWVERMSANPLDLPDADAGQAGNDYFNP
ncbi:HD domain-containing protein [Actinosynnema sp. NPDC020468]|uniref:HD domain-containing protein n=1 Tax=Actinosynnema sp. NPDC020468 TaxID=3154488 RepID=UPI00340F438E